MCSVAPRGRLPALHADGDGIQYSSVPLMPILCMSAVILLYHALLGVDMPRVTNIQGMFSFIVLARISVPFDLVAEPIHCTTWGSCSEPPVSLMKIQSSGLPHMASSCLSHA